MTALTLNSLSRSLGLSPRGRRFGGDAAPAIVAAGLIGEWRFDDGAGQTLTDASGNGHHGRLGSTAGPDVNDPAWIAPGLSFDGADDYVEVPDFGAPSTYHLDLVVKCAPATQAYSMLLVAHGLYDTDSILQIFRDGANDRLVYRVRHSSGTTDFPGSINVFDNAWHLVQVSRSASQVLAHVDGAVDVALQAVTAPPTPPTGPIWFGARSAGVGQLFLQGAEAWAAWYSAAFDEGQRAQNEAFARYLMAGRGVTLP